MPRKSPYTLCEGCGKMKAGGGQRFCWACLANILSKPSTAAPTNKGAQK